MSPSTQSSLVQRLVSLDLMSWPWLCCLTLQLNGLFGRCLVCLIRCRYLFPQWSPQNNDVHDDVHNDLRNDLKAMESVPVMHISLIVAIFSVGFVSTRAAWFSFSAPAFARLDVLIAILLPTTSTQRVVWQMLDQLSFLHWTCFEQHANMLTACLCDEE